MPSTTTRPQPEVPPLPGDVYTVADLPSWRPEITPLPDVPLPDGADVLSDWDDDTGEYRIISTCRGLVGSSRLLVSGVATQLRDGTIWNERGYDVPLVWVDELGEDGYSREKLSIDATDARNLAAALVAAATELDGWTGR